MNASSRDRERRALRAFADSLARRPTGAPALDELCRAQPELEPILRRLAEERARVELAPPRVAPGGIAAVRARLLGDGDGQRGSDAGGERYVLLGEVAHGGMGVVLHVWDAVLERPLAMKLLDLDARSPGARQSDSNAARQRDSNGPRQRDSNGASGSDAEDALRRFLVEAQVAAQLEHPGVVPIYDMGVEAGGRLYFTMPLIEGRDLDEVFDLALARSGGWSLTRALLVIGRLCEVMAYAHSRGVIHRDLKPANVLVGGFGELYVVDWGLAKKIGGPQPERPEPQDEAREELPLEPQARVGETLDGTVAGTPPYMAPEQAQGRVADVSFRTDVYGLGALLYRLLAGRAPYTSGRGASGRSDEDPARMLQWIRRGPPTPLRKVAPATPPELASLCEKAMAWRSEERYASVEELGRELDTFLEARVTGARRQGFWSEAKQRLLRRGRREPWSASPPTLAQPAARGLDEGV